MKSLICFLTGLLLMTPFFYITIMIWLLGGFRRGWYSMYNPLERLHDWMGV